MTERFYLAQDGKELIILFGGGTKKRQQADIEKAKRLLREYKKRKKEVSDGPLLRATGDED